ncbi:MAG: hypothetical protein JKY56_18390 [Kofleriaceae bacterium]|nr:hypothetical protein [Kofleriaceae bacterium]
MRSYGVRVRDGAVELNLAEESVTTKIVEIGASLREGLRSHRMGQVARDVVRLLQLGVPPEEVAYLAVKYDAEVSEYGTTHVLPVIVDSLAVLDRYPGLQAVVPVLQGMELAADSHVRQPDREILARADADMPAPELFSVLRGLVENEKALEAEALLAGAIESGVQSSVIESWFYHLCSDHFLGFGHALIYTQKAFELLGKLGWDKAGELLPALLFGIVNQTREELLPQWKWFSLRLAGIDSELSEMYETPVRSANDNEISELRLVLLDGSRTEAFDALVNAFRTGLARKSIVDAISLAASERILRFDPAIDASSTVQEGWLAVTHILTFASAVRRSLDRFDRPEVLKLLLFAGRFVNNAKTLDLRIEDRLSLGTGGERMGSLAEVTDAIAEQAAQEAITRTIGYCTSGDCQAELRAYCEDFAMSDHSSKPIVVGHLIKTCRVAFEEAQATGELTPILAFVKIAASPIRQRWITRFAHEAISFLEHGKVPRTLT